MGQHVSGRLTAAEVRTAPVGKVADGLGLWLHVLKNGTRRWFLRYQSPIGGWRRELGIGVYPKVTLAAARAEAARLRGLIEQGIDPLTPEPEPEAPPPVRTFTQAAAQFIRSHRRAWSNRQHAREWVSTIRRFARPVIGHLSVSEIETEHVLSVLRPIWHTRTETALRLRGRIERILNQEKALKNRTGENPAAWRGHLENLLPAPRKIATVAHRPALPWVECPGFMRELRQIPGVSSLALQWLVRTASRASEVTGARWSEVDRESRVWTIPGVRMKARKPHQVPLTDECLAILDQLPRLAGSDWLFPSTHAGKHISSMAMLYVMRRMGHGVNGDQSASVPHGFRSSFRDWAGESQPFPRELVELCLAHATEGQVELAYRRGNMVDKRRKVMEAWSAYLDRPPAQVVQLHPHHPATTEARTATA